VPVPTRSSFRRSRSPSFRLLPFEGTPVRSLPSSDLSRSCCRLGFLSWSSSKIALPPTSPCASTLGCPRFGIATPEHVPPLSFFPTSAACSAHGFAGLLHPAAGHRVRLVSSREPTFAGARPSSEASFPLEALRRTSGLPVTRLPASSPLVRDNRSCRFPRPRGVLPIRSSTRTTSLPASTSSLGFPRPRPSPEVSVAGGSRWFPRCPVPRGIGSPHSGRCARRGRLPVALLAGCDRGARDGYRVSHGHRAVARTPRMLLPAHGSSNDPFDGVILSRVSGPVDHRPEGR